jgi:hypothetical protein
MNPSIATVVLLASSFLWTQASAVAQDQKPSSAATICIYRPHRFEGYALKPPVYADQVELNSLHNGESVQVIVSPGQHRLNSNDKSTGIDLDAKAGQTYYMRVDIKTGAWKGHGAITLIDSQEGKYEFSQQKLALTRDLTSNRGPALVEVSNPATPSGHSVSSAQTAPSVPVAEPPKPVVDRSVEGMATVSVVTLPDGAEIYADGTFIGNAPASVKLSPGKHTIRVTQSAYKDWSREMGVPAGSDAHVTATLEKQ